LAFIPAYRRVKAIAQGGSIWGGHRYSGSRLGLFEFSGFLAKHLSFAILDVDTLGFGGQHH
jgi:hypothetical protein